MAVKPHVNFAGGELDPALHERTDLNKYQSGLSTARNVVIGKNGGALSRPGRVFFAQTQDLSGNPSFIIIPISHLGSFIEWGHQTFRLYSIDGTLIATTSHSWDEEDFNNLTFTIITDELMLVSHDGERTHTLDQLIVNLTDGTTIAASAYFRTHIGPTVKSETLSGTGYNVDYVISGVFKGQESTAVIGNFSGTPQLPDASNTNDFDVEFAPSDLIVDGATGGGDLEDYFEEIRVYRRPSAGAAFGFIGASSDYSMSGSNLVVSFSDIGADADFSNRPPRFDAFFEDNIANLWTANPDSTAMYQQRLVISVDGKFFFSRPGFPNNFYVDSPVDSDSSLATQISRQGASKVYHMIEHEGLVAFASDGIYVHVGAVSESNLAFEKRGSWVIDKNLAPISIPGGVLFVDSITNTVRQLLFSEEIGTYVGKEVSIFSNHLFQGNKITSWAFDNGKLPILWVTFKDGTEAAFSYEFTHELEAWTRLDMGLLETPHYQDFSSEYVASLSPGFNQTTDEFVPGETIFLTKFQSSRYGSKVGNRATDYYIQTGAPRFPSGEDPEGEPEEDKWQSIAAMDLMVSWRELLNDDLTDDDLRVAADTAGDWSAGVNLSCTDDAIFTDPGPGAVGTVFKVFNPKDRTEIYLTVTSRVDDNEVVCETDVEFPADDFVNNAGFVLWNVRIYKTQNTFTGLDHLDGTKVSIVADGHVLASPNNNIENYPDVTPSGGSVNLPDSYNGAIVHIGKPYVADVETLEVDTGDDGALLESKTVNKVFIKTHKSRGLYVGNRLPDDDKVDGSDVTGTHMVTMDGLDAYVVNYDEETPITGNRYQQPTSRRHEISTPGDWKGNGKVALRSVDPVHFEISSIKSDLEIYPRTDKE